MEDNFVLYAIFTEQGSSGSQMTTAPVLDVIARLPGGSLQASDAVSAYTQVKMEDAPTLLKLPKAQRPDLWIRLPRYKWPRTWHSIKKTCGSSGKELVWTFLARVMWERRSHLKPDEERTCECLFMHRQQGLLRSVYVDDIKK